MTNWIHRSLLTRACFGIVLSCLAGATSLAIASGDHENLISSQTDTENLQSIFTPDVSEGFVSPPPKSGLVESALAGAFGPSGQQPKGALSGKIVFMNSGHGWTFDPTY